MQQISAEELARKLAEDQELLLLDVREAWEVDLCQIKGSTHISMSEISRRLAEINQTSEIVVICHHGMRSFQVAAFLETQGFDKVTNLNGGIDAWATTVDTAMTRY